MQKSTHLVTALRLLATHHRMEAVERAPNPTIAEFCKSIGTNITGPSADLRAAYAEIIELANRFSLIGRIQSVSAFRKVPFATPFLRQTGGVVAGFIAEGAPIPVGSADFSTAKLPHRKIGAILPVTKQIASEIGGERTLSRDLVRALSDSESSGFFNADAATAQAPAGIIYGVTPLSGSTSPVADIAALFGAFGGNLDAAVLVTSPANGARLAAPFGFLTGARGGECSGVLHVTHHSVPDDQIAIIEPDRVALADAGLELDVAENATLSLYDSSGDAEEHISLWQQNMVAFKITRHINWLPGTAAVSWMNNVAWSATP